MGLSEILAEAKELERELNEVNKVFYLHIIYAEGGKSVKGFEPHVLHLKSRDKHLVKAWLEDSDNLKDTIADHARAIGIKPGSVLFTAVYADSKMRKELGFPDDGTKLEDVVFCLFKRWFRVKQQNGAFPIV